MEFNSIYIRCLYLGSINIFWRMSTKPEELIKLGQAIRAVRESRGFSQDKFAYEIDLGRSYYGAVERGEINVSALTLIKIARGLEVEAKELFPTVLQK